ncbi:MAG: hypothetical protein IJK23_14015 [Clostridia bacterium]|nr:hypothetical protein [Clostridia bacterium]
MPSIKPIGEAVAGTLQNTMNAGRFPHCILVSGGSDTARRDTAMYIAALIECTGGKRPCGKCRDCRKIAENIHPDVSSIETAGKSATVRLEDVRTIRETSAIMPGEGRARVFILPEADRLRVEGQNSLLKIIEEPPEYVYIIFCAEGRSSLLPTVLSRLYQVDLGAAQADISVRSRQKACDSCAAAVDALCRGDPYALAVAVRAAGKERNDIALFAGQLRLALRDAMMRGADGLSGQPELAERMAAKFSFSLLADMLAAAEYAIEAAARNANINLLVSMFAMKLADAAKI